MSIRCHGHGGWTSYRSMVGEHPVGYIHGGWTSNGGWTSYRMSVVIGYGETRSFSAVIVEIYLYVNTSNSVYVGRQGRACKVFTIIISYINARFSALLFFNHLQFFLALTFHSLFELFQVMFWVCVIGPFHS